MVIFWNYFIVIFLKLFHDGKLHSPWLSGTLQSHWGSSYNPIPPIILSWSPLELYHLTTYVFLLLLRPLSVKLMFTPACFIYSARGQVFVWWQKNKITFDPVSESELTFACIVQREWLRQKREMFLKRRHADIYLYIHLSPPHCTLSHLNIQFFTFLKNLIIIFSYSISFPMSFIKSISYWR